MAGTYTAAYRIAVFNLRNLSFVLSMQVIPFMAGTYTVADAVAELRLHGKSEAAIEAYAKIFVEVQQVRRNAARSDSCDSSCLCVRLLLLGNEP